MKIEWVSYFFFGLAALLHIYFFILESIRFAQPSVYKKFGIKEDQLEIVKLWAFNQGIYNLFLAAGMIMGLYFVNQLEIRIAGILVTFFGLCMILAGLALIYSKRKLWKAALVQMGPPIFGFIFLAFHIIEKINLSK
jgi:putative membrane protein